MTLLYLDSFDHYASAELTDKGYSSSFPASPNHFIYPGQGRRGGQAMGSGVGGVLGITVSNTFEDSDTIILGAAILWSAYYSRTAIDFLDSVGNSLLLIETTNAGEIRMTSGGQVAITATNIFTPAAYHHYEIKYTKGTGANGFAEIKKDGAILLTISNSTETAQCSAWDAFEGSAAGEFARMDDLYIMNGLGTVNNDYAGDLRVDVQRASADGAEVEFTPNLGADNWTSVDDILTDSETTWNESGIIAARDIHEVDTPTLGTVIHGVQQVVHNRKTDAGTVTVDLISEKPAGTGEKVNGAAITSSDNWAFALAIRETDPDDDVTFTDARIAANEWGYKIQNIVT